MININSFLQKHRKKVVIGGSIIAVAGAAAAIYSTYKSQQNQQQALQELRKLQTEVLSHNSGSSNSSSSASASGAASSSSSSNGAAAALRGHTSSSSITDIDAIRHVFRQLLINLLTHTSKFNARNQYKLDSIGLEIRKFILMAYSMCLVYIICKLQVNILNTQMYLKVSFVVLLAIVFR